jgi:predicted metalloprotease with PDZ domain
MKTSVWLASAVLVQSVTVGYAQEQGSAPAAEAAPAAESAANDVQDSGVATARGSKIAAAADVSYPGDLNLKVDLTDLDRRVINVQESVPVRPGPLTLLYPEWLPGNHAPRGPIDAMAGLTISAGGHRVDWARDLVNVYAFHVVVPPGVSRLDVEFQYASALVKEQGRTVMTPDILGLQWNTVVLYPAGYFASRITVVPSITLPDGWEFAGALEVESRRASVVHFRPASLEMLVDSPLFAGHYFKSLDLDPNSKVPVHLNLFADSPEALDVKPPELAAHRKLVREAYGFFGAPHYDHYEFLLAISEHFGGIGLEHHRSSENQRPVGYFTDWEKTGAGRDLLSHEYSHSWNGKFRRPAGLATQDFNVPMRNSLLWVYEGLTNYTGYVLAARSGLWSEDFARQAWASVAASMDRNRPGRAWRDLEDTTEQPIMTARRPLSWLSWQRTEDYYTEGQLVWLDVDTKIRELTGEKRSLDDFAHAFYGIDPGKLGPETYTFADIVQALTSVAAFDWEKFLTERLHGHGPGAPLDGLTRGGWKLAYVDKPSEYIKSVEEQRKAVDFTYSLGFAVSTQNSSLTEVRWGGPAYDAGLAMGTVLIAVNGREYKPEVLKSAVLLARADRHPIELIVKNLDRFRTVHIAYFDGPKFPQLQRIDSSQDRLGAIMKPRA